jgi:hypothetical protein
MSPRWKKVNSDKQTQQKEQQTHRKSGVQKFPLLNTFVEPFKDSRKCVSSGDENEREIFLEWEQEKSQCIFAILTLASVYLWKFV